MMSNNHLREYHRKSLILALQRCTFGQLTMMHREAIMDAEYEFMEAMEAYNGKSWWYRLWNRPPVGQGVQLTAKYEARLARVQQLVDYLEKEDSYKVMMSYEEIEEFMLDQCKELKGVSYVD